MKTHIVSPLLLLAAAPLLWAQAPGAAPVLPPFPVEEPAAQPPVLPPSGAPDGGAGRAGGLALPTPPSATPRLATPPAGAPPRTVRPGRPVDPAYTPPHSGFGAGMAPGPAPRGEQIILEIKLKVLQRHFESSLAEAVEAERAALFVSGGEKDGLLARGKALREFADKLEADIRALPEPRPATVTFGGAMVTPGGWIEGGGGGVAGPGSRHGEGPQGGVQVREIRAGGSDDHGAPALPQPGPVTPQ